MNYDEAQNHNWVLKKSNKDTRFLCIDTNDLERILIWHKNFVKQNPFSKGQFENSKEVLEEKGPITQEKCSIVVVIKVLKDIEFWYKFYPDSKKTDLDKETFNIVEMALNPPESTKSKS